MEAAISNLLVMRGATVPPNSVHLNGCLDACSKADAWEEALALFESLEVQEVRNCHGGYGSELNRKDSKFDFRDLFINLHQIPSGNLT